MNTLRLLAGILVFLVLQGCGRDDQKQINVVPRDLSCPINYHAHTYGWGECDCIADSDPNAAKFECGTKVIPAPVPSPQWP